MEMETHTALVLHHTGYLGTVENELPRTVSCQAGYIHNEKYLRPKEGEPSPSLTLRTLSARMLHSFHRSQRWLALYVPPTFAICWWRQQWLSCSYWVLLVLVQKSGTRTSFPISKKGSFCADHLLVHTDHVHLSDIRMKEALSYRCVSQADSISPSIPQHAKHQALRDYGHLYFGITNNDGFHRTQNDTGSLWPTQGCQLNDDGAMALMGKQNFTQKQPWEGNGSKRTKARHFKWE